MEEVQVTTTLEIKWFTHQAKHFYVGLSRNGDLSWGARVSLPQDEGCWVMIWSMARAILAEMDKPPAKQRGVTYPVNWSLVPVAEKQ